LLDDINSLYIEAVEDILQEDLNFLCGTATGIGSMPHGDPGRALGLIKETLPQGPHWPQLPRRRRAEGFNRQYLTPLEKLGLLNLEISGNPFFKDHAEDWVEKVAKFYELYLTCQKEGDSYSAYSFFAFPEESAAGFYKFLEEDWESSLYKPRFLKGQLSGPLSLGLQVNAADGTAAFYHRDLRDIITKTLVLSVKFQVKALKKFSLPVLIFIDEPLLLSFGQSPYISLSREAIYESLKEVVMAIKEEGAYAGIHCCSGVDWSILFQLPLHVVNFDAYSYFDSMLVYSEELDIFLKKGGLLGWGLIPTSEDIEYISVLSLREKFYEGIRRLSRQGVDETLLRKQYLLTPSCGTGTLSIPQSEKVYRVTGELKNLLQQESSREGS